MEQSLYRWAARAVHRLPLGSGKLGRSLAGRREAAQGWLDWAARHRGSAPLIWVHGASVGEALTAQPVVARLRSTLPAVQVIHTHTSPSVEQSPAPFAADARGYLPLDEPEPVARVLDCLNPTLLAFSRGDLWPELVAAARARNVPVAVLGATLRPGSGRRNPLLRPLYAALHGAVSWLGAVSRDDAARWTELGVAASAVEVTGDPRHDHVIERATRIERLEALLPWCEGGPTLVAGSVEPPDLPIVLEAARSVLSQHSSARLLLVPHDPGERSSATVAARCRRHGLEVTLWPEGDAPPGSRVVVVTARGLLYDLYALGAAAYVGGGFRNGRLHSVAEPAVYGLPVIVGPRWRGAADADALLARGGAEALPGPRQAAQALALRWLGWLVDQGERQRAGMAARGTLHAGAAASTASALLRLMGVSGGEGPALQAEPPKASRSTPVAGPPTARR